MQYRRTVLRAFLLFITQEGYSIRIDGKHSEGNYWMSARICKGEKTLDSWAMKLFGNDTRNVIMMWNYPTENLCEKKLRSSVAHDQMVQYQYYIDYTYIHYYIEIKMYW